MINRFDTDYLSLVDIVYSHGVDQPTRNGFRRTTFVNNLEFDLSTGLFPLQTIRFIPWKNVIHELIWFLNGETNTKYLQDNDVHIWDANADPGGNVGTIYGYQWRNYNGEGVDQIVNSLKLLREKNHSTRNVVIAWNPAQQWAMKLPPCHFGFQLYRENGYLSLLASMRSSDAILGLPTNIASYALLLLFYCKHADLKPAKLHMSLGDTHLYEDHLPKIPLLLNREPLPPPRVEVHQVTTDLRNMQPSFVTLHDYQYRKAIKFQLTA